MRISFTFAHPFFFSCVVLLLNFAVYRYPKDCIMNQVVWPYADGEVIVQNYNAMLSLARLVKASSGVLIVENDAMHDVCSRLLGNPKHVSTTAINAEIARHLSGFLCPAQHLTAGPPTEGGDGTAIMGNTDGGM